MNEVRGNDSRFGGEYMVQDRNHMSEIDPVTDEANRGRARQTEQSQTVARQQGSSDNRARRQQQSGDAGFAERSSD